MISILHIGKYFAPFKGGIENMMLALIKQQVAAGLSVSVLAHHHDPSKPYSESQEIGATIHRIPILGTLLFVPLAISGFWHLKRLLKAKRVDIVHAHLPNVTCFGLLLFPRYRYKKLILHWHSDVIGTKPHWGIKLLYPVYRIFEKALLRRADNIIVTSHNYLISSKPLAAFQDKCTVIPLGLEDTVELSGTNNDNSKNVDNERVDSMLDNDNVGALCIGRLTYYKGHEFLIRAMSLLKDKQLTLSIVGTGEEGDKLKALASKLGVNEQVRFLGHVDDTTLNLLIQRCDFLVLPSIERTEAFGLVLLEAMRAGKACICTNVEGSGMSNVVEHEKTGLVVQQSDSHALANAIARLNNKTISDSYGELGRQRFADDYLVDKIEKSVRALYLQ